MGDFTIIEVYQCMLYWQQKAYEAAKQNYPIEQDGKLAYHVGNDHGEQISLQKIETLKSALVIMSNFKEVII